MVRDEKPRTVYWLEDKLYLNITNKCSNCCIFCFKNFKRGVGDFTLKLIEEPSLDQVTAELSVAWQKRSWREIVFCGFGESTERLDLLIEISRWIKRHFGRSFSIRVNTNGHGYLLNPGREVAQELRDAGIDKASVSLNAADEETYNEVCKPLLQEAFGAVLDFTRKAKGQMEVEVTAVTAPEVDLHKVEDLAKDLGIKFRLRPCIPCFW